MAMTPKGMADYIISKIRNIDRAENAINTFYSALCEYVEDNAEVLYAWSATNSVGVPDPVTVIKAKIKTTGSLSPSGCDNPTDALQTFSNDLNTEAKKWQVDWDNAQPTGLKLSPAFILPTISITASMADNMEDAWLAVCAQIIAGIKAATPSASGSHGAFSGTASFTSIL